jgi:hypothetical protein
VRIALRMNSVCSDLSRRPSKAQTTCNMHERQGWAGWEEAIEAPGQTKRPEMKIDADLLQCLGLLISQTYLGGTHFSRSGTVCP